MHRLHVPYWVGPASMLERIAFNEFGKSYENTRSHNNRYDFRVYVCVCVLGERSQNGTGVRSTRVRVISSHAGATIDFTQKPVAFWKYIAESGNCCPQCSSRTETRYRVTEISRPYSIYFGGVFDRITARRRVHKSRLRIFISFLKNNHYESYNIV